MGTGLYVDDLKVDGMLYGGVLRSKYPRAVIKSIDVSAAKAHPGVEAVLTAADVPGNRYWGMIFKDWPALVAMGEETRYVGDALVLVAARSKTAAREALGLIAVEYEELAAITTTATAMCEGPFHSSPGKHSQYHCG
ncbi:hypothetical protein N752_25500 [Desulforamulus aquiferis]|nr:hypothetical protein N752_25500 [Desulforamulus aquiferis]